MRITVLFIIIFLMSMRVSAQDWQWMRRLGQQYDAATLDGRPNDIYADVPINLEKDIEGNLILEAIVGKNPDTCRGGALSSCTADTNTRRLFNSVLIRYNCAGHEIWRKYIGFQSLDPQYNILTRNGAGAPAVTLSHDGSEIIIVDQFVTGNATYPTRYRIGDTLINIPYQTLNTSYTNLLVRIDLSGHLKYWKLSGVTTGCPFLSSYDRNHPLLRSTSDGDIIGIAYSLPTVNPVASFKLFDDSVTPRIHSVYQGLPQDYMYYTYRMDTLGHLKWATAFSAYVSAFNKMFLDQNNEVSIMVTALPRVLRDSFIINDTKIKDTAISIAGYNIYNCIARVSANGSLRNVVIPPRTYLTGPIMSPVLQHTDKEGNSYISVTGMAEVDSFLGIPFHRSGWRRHLSQDSMVQMLIKVDTTFRPIWHYNVNDSIKVVYGDTGTYLVFATCKYGNFGEDKDNHIYVPIVLGPDTFYWQDQKLSVPIPNKLWQEYGREGFAIVDKTTAHIVGYHLLDNQLQPGSATSHALKYYGFNHPVVDNQGQLYTANLFEGYQIAGHDTITAYPGGRDGVDVGFWKWGLNCRSDTSLLSPLGQGTDLVADGVSTTQIRVRWIDSATYETGYRIYRSPDGQTSWQLIDSVASGITAYVNAGLPEGTVYYYRVAAVNGTLQGAFSTIDSGQTWTLLGIDDRIWTSKVNVYPNPASSQVTMEFMVEAAEPVTIELYNALGQRVFSTAVTLQAGYQQQSLDVQNYTQGTYYVTVIGHHTSVHASITIVR